MKVFYKPNVFATMDQHFDDSLAKNLPKPVRFSLDKDETNDFLDKLQKYLDNGSITAKDVPDPFGLSAGKGYIYRGAAIELSKDILFG